ncbi:MAG: ATP-binding protein [Sphingobium sp.]
MLGRILIILVLVLGTEFIANTFLFERASQFVMREDEARRTAEHLVIARRVLDRTPTPDRILVARELSTTHFSLKWAPSADTSTSRLGLNTLRDQIQHLEPELLRARLRFYLKPLRQGGDIAGSLELTDHSVVIFHTAHTPAIWSLTFGRIVTLVAPTLILVLIGGLMVRLTLRPLRVLMRATGKVGKDTPVPVPEQGPPEIRSLIHAFNAMQDRIHRLITSRTQALAAVGHDLRTPLARLQLRLDVSDLDGEARAAMNQDIDEMTDLLRSLQIYLSGEGTTLPAEHIDLSAMIQTLVDAAKDLGHDAFYLGPSRLEIWARPIPIRRALSNLIDNALHYGGNVRVSVQQDSDAIVLTVDDDGPGIDKDKLVDVLQPFVRLDGARTRNTRGMGLGLAIVNDVVRAEGGELILGNRLEGGLRATIRLPVIQK